MKRCPLNKSCNNDCELKYTTFTSTYCVYFCPGSDLIPEIHLCHVPFDFYRAGVELMKEDTTNKTMIKCSFCAYSDGKGECSKKHHPDKPKLCEKAIKRMIKHFNRE